MDSEEDSRVYKVYREQTPNQSRPSKQLRMGFKVEWEVESTRGWSGEVMCR